MRIRIRVSACTNKNVINVKYGLRYSKAIKLWICFFSFMILLHDATSYLAEVLTIFLRLSVSCSRSLIRRYSRFHFHVNWMWIWICEFHLKLLRDLNSRFKFLNFIKWSGNHVLSMEGLPMRIHDTFWMLNNWYICICKFQ